MVIDDALLDELATQGDPPVDDVVAQHAAETKVKANDLVKNIARNPELPSEQRSPAIAEYLEQRPELPDWCQPGLLDRGASFFARYSVEIGTALFCASLPQAYAGHRGARVLSLTGKLVTDPVRRVNETTQMVVNAMARDGLTPATGKGYMDARRVRLMHAAVRYLVLHDPSVEKTDNPDAGMSSWNPSGGLPINQEDLLGTFLTFTTVALATLERQGLDYDPDDAEAYVHAWCVVAFLLGVRSDLLPISLDDARDLQARMFPRLQGPSQDALYLGRALNKALSDSLPWPLRGLPGSLITFYTSPEIAAINGVRTDWTKLAIGPLRWLMGLISQDERHDRLVKDLADHMTAAVLTKFLGANRPGREPFAMPRELQGRIDSVQKRWRL
jgi:ER-bound oxygenase mpaB/B'/Rubber oxygenase, catalytic domain